MAPTHRPRRRSDVSRAHLIAIGLLIAVGCVAPACAQREGAAFACECEWLTDYDDASKVKVDVCAADDAEAPIVARGCAQVGTPAPIQSCKCARARDATAPCRHGCRE